MSWKTQLMEFIILTNNDWLLTSIEVASIINYKALKSKSESKCKLYHRWMAGGKKNYIFSLEISFQCCWLSAQQSSRVLFRPRPRFPFSQSARRATLDKSSVSLLRLHISQRASHLIDASTKTLLYTLFLQWKQFICTSSACMQLAFYLLV